MPCQKFGYDLYRFYLTHSGTLRTLHDTTGNEQRDDDMPRRRAKFCSIPGCGKPHRGLGYCNAHYMRFIRNDDPLAGKTSRGEPLRWLDEAMFRQTDECVFWPFSQELTDDAKVKINGRTVRVCRLVATITHGEPPSPDHQAAHSCGMGHVSCINPRHIRWALPEENAEDKRIHALVRGPEAVRLIESLTT